MCHVAFNQFFFSEMLTKQAYTVAVYRVDGYTEKRKAVQLTDRPVSEWVDN